jgi:hypothetical protein
MTAGLEQVTEAARELAERLAADIPLARTRDEHVRVTARANEATNLLAAIIDLSTR